ncbi:MAG: hypothetical protein AAF551_09595 [Bacteroidota bacterium]
MDMKRNDIDQLIEESLKNEPSFQLRKDFKDKVTLRIRRKERRSQRILYLALGFVSIAVFSICLVTIGSYFDLKSLNINDGFTPTACQGIEIKQ